MRSPALRASWSVPGFVIALRSIAIAGDPSDPAAAATPVPIEDAPAGPGDDRAGPGDDRAGPGDRGAPDPPRAGERAPTGSFQIGAGFSSEESFIAVASLRQDDLFGTGQRLALTAALSARAQDFRLRHEVPDLAAGLSLSTELFAHQRRYDGFAREGVGGTITVGRALGHATRAYLRYRAEQVTIDPAAGLDPLRDARGARPRPPLGGGLIASLGAGVAYDTRDDRAWPTAGTRLELSADVADRRLGSDHALVKVGAALDHARPLGPFILRLAGRAGYVRSLDPSGVPLSERLQHDGHGDVRGYPLGALGMTTGLDGGAFAAGRDLEALGRIELELPISRTYGLSIAGFADAGLGYNADPTWGPVGASVARAVGVSILWRSPIGPLRFDWAFPLDGDDRGAPQFLFGIGSSF